MFYAYILKSRFRTHYYGSTEDLNKRLIDHNSGKVKYTKGRRPWFLHYSEAYDTRSEVRESSLKVLMAMFF